MIKIKEGRANEEQLDGRDGNQWSQKGGSEEGEQREGRQIRTEDKGGGKEG